MKIFNYTGKTIGRWTFLEKVSVSGTSIYRCRCVCGYERVISSQKVSRLPDCPICREKEKLERYRIHAEKQLGRRNGRLTLVAYKRLKKAHGYLVKCDCGSEVAMKMDQFCSTKSCKKCALGNWPGRIVNNTKLIQKIDRYNWQKECLLCGSIFQGTGRQKDCGCSYKKRLFDLASKKVGSSYKNLTIKKVLHNENGHNMLLIRCKCGKKFTRPNGHEFKSISCGCLNKVPTGDKASNATLKNYEVKSMREMYASGLYTIDQLAKIFNKSNNYIYRIVHRKIWKHV